MGFPKLHWITVDSDGEAMTACGMRADSLPMERYSKWPDDTSCFHCRCVLRLQGLIKSRPRSS